MRLPAAAFAFALTLGAASPAVAGETGWRVYVGEAAARFGLPETWVLRVIAAESGGRTHLGGRPITSHAGAMGLMQVMPETWASLRARYRLGPDPHDPRDNILAGTAYLRHMYDRFGYPGLFAAYNAGPGRYGEYLARGRPLPRETRDYVAKITGTPPVPQDLDARSRGAGAPRLRRTDVRSPAIRPNETAAIDPIFLKRAAAEAPTLAAATEERGIWRMERADEAAAAAGTTAASIFLLRKREHGGDR